MQIGQNLASLGPAFLQALQGPSTAPNAQPPSAATAHKGQNPNLEGAKVALESGRAMPRGSFLDIRA